jgi:protein-L-isoaspartate(D-aspartate) O-methyltransferase
VKDGFREKGLRRELVQLLKQKGIHSDLVLEAIGNVPRHLFLDSAFLELAYKDMALQIGAGQTISQPYTVAFQTQALEIKKGDKVLEIGTGSGYQAAVLMYCGAKVFSIERQKSLYDKAKVFLPQLGYNPRLFYGDGYKGLPTFAPFQKIIVTAGAPKIPEDLVTQLAKGGRMIIPVGANGVQTMVLLTKDESGNVETQEFGEFRFVPMLKEKA